MKLKMIGFLLAVCLVLAAGIVGDIPKPTESTETSTTVRVSLALTKTPQDLKKTLEDALTQAVGARVEAVQQREAAVRREHGDLVKLMKDKTDGKVLEQNAMALIDVMAGDSKATIKVDDADMELQRVMAKSAQRIVETERLSTYEAKKVVLAAVSRAYPKVASWQAEPEVAIETISTSLSIPEPDVQYEALLGDQDFYSRPAYEALNRASKEELPDGALVTLVKLIDAPIPTGDLRDGWAIPSIEIVKRYETRACGVIADALAHPDRYGMKARSPRYDLVKLLTPCPAELRKQVMEAALRAGWRAVESYLPGDEEWADALLDHYKDSPYGPPVRNRKERQLTASESEEVERTFAIFLGQFDSELAKGSTTELDARFAAERAMQVPDEKIKFWTLQRVNQWWDERTKGA